MTSVVDRTGLREAAKTTADWLGMVQAIYHGTVQNWPNETRDTCEAGMCGDYREHRDRLRAALDAEPLTGLDVVLREMDLRAGEYNESASSRRAWRDAADRLRAVR